MPLDKSQKEKFLMDGYVLLENVISKERCNFLRELIEKIAAQERDSGEACSYGYQLQRVWNLISKHHAFQEIVCESLILEVMDWIFDRDTLHQKYFLSSFQANILGIGAVEQVLHIDTPVPDPVPIWPIKANSIWCVDDFTSSNGATVVIPGSHKFQRRPNKDHDQNAPGQIQVIAPKGSVLITHGALWHRSGKNSSNQSRIGLLASFAASYAREIANEEDYLRVVPFDRLDIMSTTLKTLLGVGHGIRPGAVISGIPSTKKK